MYSLFTFYFTVAVRVRYAGATDEDLDGADTHTQTHCTRAGISRRGPRRPERRKRGEEASRTTGRSTLKRHLFDCDFLLIFLFSSSEQIQYTVGTHSTTCLFAVMAWMVIAWYWIFASMFCRILLSIYFWFDCDIHCLVFVLPIYDDNVHTVLEIANFPYSKKCNTK